LKAVETQLVLICTSLSLVLIFLYAYLNSYPIDLDPIWFSHPGGFINLFLVGVLSNISLYIFGSYLGLYGIFIVSLGTTCLI
jgi:hypothetical protein